MTLTLPITPEEQAKLEAKASAHGLSLDAFVSDVLKQVAFDDEASAHLQAGNPLPLPLWPGRITGSLRREDIYDDVG